MQNTFPNTGDEFTTQDAPQTTTSDQTDNTVRAAKDAEPTQDVQLGAYHDVAPIQSSAVNTTIITEPYQSFNMETYPLSGVLDREYDLGLINWQTSSPSFTILATYDFPSVLFNQPFMSGKISGFRYFKGGIRMTFRMSSTLFNYGSVMIWYTPSPTTDGYYNSRQVGLARTAF